MVLWLFFQENCHAPGHTFMPACAQATAASNGAAAHENVTHDSSLWLQNTMSGRKEQFQLLPEQGRKVSMYCCGVTVYDFSHIGEA